MPVKASIIRIIQASGRLTRATGAYSPRNELGQSVVSSGVHQEPVDQREDELRQAREALPGQDDGLEGRAQHGQRHEGADDQGQRCG